MGKITINRNLISALSKTYDNSYLTILMNNNTKYSCCNNIKITYEDFYQNIGQNFSKSDERNEHKPFDTMDYELYYYITCSKKDFIEIEYFGRGKNYED